MTGGRDNPQTGEKDLKTPIAIMMVLIRADRPGMMKSRSN